jgi:hypothetical protein
MSQIVAFLVAHEAVLASLGVAVLDLLFALNPSLEANGVLHQVYLWIKGLVAPDAPKAS